MTLSAERAVQYPSRSAGPLEIGLRVSESPPSRVGLFTAGPLALAKPDPATNFEMRPLPSESQFSRS